MNAPHDNRIVAWQDAYALDLPEIDAQHQVLFDLMNALWNAIIARASADDTLALVRELERYTIVHFTEEETFMRRAGYSGFDAHKHAHDRFVARVAEEKSRIEAGTPFGLEILHFLKDWLVQHILVEDRRSADEISQTQRRSEPRSQPRQGLSRFFRRLGRSRAAQGEHR